MPTYEYECESCGTHDVDQRITAPALTACEKCGKPVRRLISRSSFALRGGGWYADGYAAKGGSGGSSGKPGGSGGPGTGVSAGTADPGAAAPPAAPAPAPAPGGLQKAG
ncbi:MAG: hypothetical protein NVSMB23_19240 [Myxococcales bacterium]